MNRRLILALLAALMAFATTSAQEAKPHYPPIKQLATPSIDPDDDAAAIARMRHKMDSIRQFRPTVALVLAGGGAKGAAHIGALEYIEQHGIPIDIVLGTSMGGLIGGLVSMGYPSHTIDSILTHTNWGIMLSDQVPVNKISYLRRQYNETYFIRSPFHYESEEWQRRAREDYKARKLNENAISLTSSEMGQEYTASLIANLPDGYIYGYNVNNIINSLTVGYQDSIDFCDLPIPYCCVATDLVSMKAKYWTHGHLADAMRSTMSIPFFFTPVRRDGRIYIDGGTRNNFPTDMARAFGADYIIGVDLSQPRSYSEISGMTNLLMQCISLMGKNAFDNNLPLADVYIHPDMSGMNMMSFDSASIAECLRRGYVAAESQAKGLEAIRQKVGTVKSRPLCNTPGININNNKVFIGSIVYDGIDSGMVSHFRKTSKLQNGHTYSSEDIEEELALMYGSGLFDQVSYSLYGDHEPFTLAFHCKRGPIHQFGFGLRFDSKTMLSAAFNIGFNKRKLSGFKADFSGVIGNNPSATLDLRYSFLNGPSLGLNIHTRYQTISQYSAQQAIVSNMNQSVSLWYNCADLYLITHSWRDGSIKAGIKYSVAPYNQNTLFRLGHGDSITIHHIDNDYYSRYIWDGDRTTTIGEWSEFALTPYLELIYNNTDDSYFPTKGLDAGLRFDFVYYHQTPTQILIGEEDGNPIYDLFGNICLSHNINAHARGVIPLLNRIDLIPSLWMNTNFEHDANEFSAGILPSWLTCAIGGTTAGRYYPNQLPYIGYNLPHFTIYSPVAVVGNVDLRLRLTNKAYVSLTSAAYSIIATNIDRDITRRYRMNRITDYAFALQLGYKSLVGPISFNVHWSRYNEPSKWGVYFSAGFDF